MRVENQTTDTRLKVAETRIDTLEQRVTTHGEEIDDNAAKLKELAVRAHYRDESMGELKAMSKATSDALDSLRQEFAKESMRNESRFDKRDAASYKDVKGVVVGAVVGGIVMFLLARIGLG